MHYLFSEELEKLGFQQRVIKGIELILPPMKTIPAGTFFMGSDRKANPTAQKDESPQHELFLETFHIAAYPVTVAEYAYAVSAGAVKAISNQKLHMPLTWEAQLNYPHCPMSLLMDVKMIRQQGRLYYAEGIGCHQFLMSE